MSTPAFLLRNPENHARCAKPLRKRKLSPPQIDTPRLFSPSRQKRAKTTKILGQSLPVHRIIETLDRNALQLLLQQVAAANPQVAQSIVDLAPKPETKDALAVMRAKFDAITAHLPYKCSAESDYSYTRVKPYLCEFLSTLSDFILNMLPPLEVDLQPACTILDAITEMIHKLPNFSNSEFQYTHAMAYDQLSTLWQILLDAADERLLVRVEAEMGLLRRLQKHNELSGGKLTQAVELAGRGQLPLLGGLITVDYSSFRH